MCLERHFVFPEGNSTFPQGTFLTLQDGEPNDLHNATDGVELHKSFDHHGSQTNTLIQWSSSRYKFSKERQKTWKNPYEQTLHRFLEICAWLFMKNSKKSL